MSAKRAGTRRVARRSARRARTRRVARRTVRGSAIGSGGGVWDKVKAKAVNEYASRVVKKAGVPDEVVDLFNEAPEGLKHPGKALIEAVQSVSNN